MSIIITLPLPHKNLSPNARCHWRARAKATQGYRYAASVEGFKLFGHGGPRWTAATVQCTFYFKDIRRRDADNLLASMKAAFDGFADAGLVVNDAAFTYLPVKQEKDKSNPRVVVEIRKDGAE